MVIFHTTNQNIEINEINDYRTIVTIVLNRIYNILLLEQC